MIKKPVITEKSMGQTAYNRYTFVVDQDASKGQIKEYVEKTFGVNVVKVRTLTGKQKTNRSFRTGHIQTKQGVKKAIVTLKPKQSIKYFETK